MVKSRVMVKGGRRGTLHLPYKRGRGLIPKGGEGQDKLKKKGDKHDLSYSKRREKGGGTSLLFPANDPVERNERILPLLRGKKGEKYSLPVE